MAQPGQEQSRARQKRQRGALLEDLCFEAQQAAEKAIKAVFVHRGESFPYIHDLDELLNGSKEAVSRSRSTSGRRTNLHLSPW